MGLIRWPGLIDVHVHLRDPGATHKEDFTTGSRAAVAGGFTFIIDMPNNPLPTISITRLLKKIKLSRIKSVCNKGFHYGTEGHNLPSFSKAWKNKHVFGLKVYCNHTTGNPLIEDKKLLDRVFGMWKTEKPILVHAEDDKIDYILFLSQKYRRRVHVCHIATQSQLETVRKTVKHYDRISIGVTPQHLFLTEVERKQLGNFGIVKPTIKSKKDQNALWEGIYDRTISVVESDHAPHTLLEKLSDQPPFGMPGLESTLGLLLKAVHDRRIKLERVKYLLYDSPQHIFSIPKQAETFIEFDPERSYFLAGRELETKCGWSPFSGWKLYGKVEREVVHDKTLVKEGRMI